MRVSTCILKHMSLTDTCSAHTRIINYLLADESLIDMVGTNDESDHFAYIRMMETHVFCLGFDWRTERKYRVPCVHACSVIIQCRRCANNSNLYMCAHECVPWKSVLSNVD